MSIIFRKHHTGVPKLPRVCFFY